MGHAPGADRLLIRPAGEPGRCRQPGRQVNCKARPKAARYARSQPGSPAPILTAAQAEPLPEPSQICDNYATHKTPDIRAWLERHPRFHVHFTPTGSSWINQVERWFAYLTEQKIRRGTHRSVQALETDIRTWIADWNRNPHPFTWTKNAEEILQSLAKYLTRISGGEH